MKKVMAIFLGIVTGFGGFLEVGSIATAAQGGADFGYQLIWAIGVGCVGLIILVEMSGRLALASGRTVADAMRERFGARFFAFPLVIVLVVSVLVMASEIGGVSMAIEMATGIGYRWWVLLIALLCWALLWNGTFSILENGSSILGLVSIVFIVAAFRLHPDWGKVAHGLAITRPNDDRAHYWFTAVNIVGASISPYLYLFYSSGAIEEEWDPTYRRANQVTAVGGMILGGILSVAVLVCAARVFNPNHISVSAYEQLGTLLPPALGKLGFWGFIATLAITCFGAAAEIALSCAYLLAQGFGWEWKEDAHPKQHARFSLSYTVLILVAAFVMLMGPDPLTLTNISMAVTAASLPVTVIPMLVLMNDESSMHGLRNGWVGNAALVVLGLLSVVLAIVAFPLQILGG